MSNLAKRMELLQAEGAYAVLNKATALERKGRNIIHFEIGQPDFPTPKIVSDAGIAAIKKGMTKYNPPLGILPLRKAIANEINKTRNISISENQIAVTPSGKSAIFAAMAAVIEKGDEIMYPDPGFPTYHALVDFFGGIRRPIPLRESSGFSFDMKVFKKYFSKKTKVIILNSPSNPTGGVMPQKDLEEIADIVKGSNCWVITDEMYSKIIYDLEKYSSFYAINKIRNQTILVDGFSKTFSMTGWRIGYLAAPLKIIDKVDYLLTHTFGCTATFTQYAVLEGLSHPNTFIKEMLKEFNERRKYVVAELNKIKGVTCQMPNGAFYVFPNISSFGKSSKFIANYLLEKGSVATLDGTSFGKYGEGYLRISYATSMSELKEGIHRIKNALGKL